MSYGLMPYSWVVSYSYACIPLCTGWLDLSLQSPPQNQEIPLFWKHCPWEVMLTQHHSSLWFMKENPTQGKKFIFTLFLLFLFLFIYYWMRFSFSLEWRKVGIEWRKRENRMPNLIWYRHSMTVVGDNELGSKAQPSMS